MYITIDPSHPKSYTHICTSYTKQTTDMINYVSKALVSFGRIEAFLEREEVEPGSVSSSNEQQHDSAPALIIRNGAFRWGGSGEGAEEGNGITVPPTLQGACFGCSFVVECHGMR